MTVLFLTLAFSGIAAWLLWDSRVVRRWKAEDQAWRSLWHAVLKQEDRDWFRANGIGEQSSWGEPWKLNARWK